MTSWPSDLKENSFSVHSPEVGDRVTAVTSTRQQLQSRVTARTQLLWNTQSPVSTPSPGGAHLLYLCFFLLCCFCLALSQMAGRSCSLDPSAKVQPREQTTTPKHDFFRIWQLWLLVFRIAQPERWRCAFLSSAVDETTTTCRVDCSP